MSVYQEHHVIANVFDHIFGMNENVNCVVPIISTAAPSKGFFYYCEQRKQSNILIYGEDT